MFKWEQGYFGLNTDYWALSNPRVYRKLAVGWERSTKWKKMKAEMRERDLKAACCLDSYTCPDELRLDRRRWVNECDEYQHLPGYLEENLKGKELVVLALICILLIL